MKRRSLSAAAALFQGRAPRAVVIRSSRWRHNRWVQTGAAATVSVLHVASRLVFHYRWRTDGNLIGEQRPFALAALTPLARTVDWLASAVNSLMLRYEMLLPS